MPSKTKLALMTATLCGCCLSATSIHAQSSDAPPEGSGPRATSQSTLGAERYDAVGYATIFTGKTSPDAIAAAHPSLPVGSFAEVTSTTDGKTIVVIIDAPMQPAPGYIIALTPGAFRLLGADSSAPAGVRVRRINPLGADQQALREGRAAANPIDAPLVLLTALRRRLPAMPRGLAVSKPVPLAVPRAAPPRGSTGPGALYPVPGSVTGSVTDRASGRPAQVPTSGFYVQVAALSNPTRANELAQQLAGQVRVSGGIYRVRLGPFADSATADRARAQAAQAGYGDARIIRE